MNCLRESSLKTRINRYGSELKQPDGDVFLALTKLCQILSHKRAKLSGLNFDDLYTESLSKINRLFKNFKPELNDNFFLYSKKSLEFYLLNYVRDHSFTAKISRKEKSIYQSCQKYRSFLEASYYLKISQKELKEIFTRVKNNRIQVNKENLPWINFDDQTTDDLITDVNETLSPLEFEMLYTKTVDKASNKEMLKTYGVGWEKKLKKARETLVERFSE